MVQECPGQLLYTGCEEGASPQNTVESCQIGVDGLGQLNSIVVLQSNKGQYGRVNIVGGRENTLADQLRTL